MAGWGAVGRRSARRCRGPRLDERPVFAPPPGGPRYSSASGVRETARRMKTLLKALGWTAAFVFAAAAAAVVVVLSIDPNRHKDWIASRFQEATGRTLSLEGDVAVRLYPWLGLEVNGVGIGNAKGSGDAPLAYVDHASLRVKLLPLLRGRYEVDTVNVRNAVLHFERDAQGVSNWDGLAGGGESEAAALPPPSSSRAGGIALGGIAVENAALTWDDRQAGVRYEVSDLNLTTTEFVYGEPIDLSLDFRGVSTRPAIEAEVRLSGTVAYDADARRIRIQPLNGRARIEGGNVPGSPARVTLDAAGASIDPDRGAFTLDRFTVHGLGLEVAGNVDAEWASSPPGFRGRLDVRPFDLRSLAGQLGRKPPPTADGSALTRVALAGRFSGSAAGLRLRELDFRLDDTTMTGDFEITRPAGTPSVHALRFDLHLDEVDLDRYAAPPGSAKRQEPPANRAGREAEKNQEITPPAPGAAIPLFAIFGTARHPDVDGRLRIGKLVAAGAALEALEMRLNARDGVLKLAPASARLYGGRLAGDVRLDVRRLEEPRVEVRADLEGIDVESFLRDVAGEARVRGKGDVSAALSAAGGDLERWKRSLAGRVNVDLRDGALVGVDLGRRLEGWKRFKDERSVAFDHAAATDFSRLTGTLKANGGIVRLDDLDAETPVLELTGTGVLADLHDDVIDYRILVTVANPVGGPGGKLLSELVGLELPLEVEGPLDHPRLGLDWGAALGSLLVPSLLKKVVPPLLVPVPDGSGERTDGGAGFDPVGKLLDEVFKRRR